MIQNVEETSKQVEAALDSVRPYLKIDEGGVELVSVSEDGIVEVRLLGECSNCSLNMMTLRAGIERVILSSVPGIKRIEAV